MTLVPATLACTLVFTAGAPLVTAPQAGAGFLLYVAMLGARAAWLLPAHVASPFAWSSRTALPVSALVFIVVTRQLFGALSQP